MKHGIITPSGRVLKARWTIEMEQDMFGEIDWSCWPEAYHHRALGLFYLIIGERWMQWK